MQVRELTVRDAFEFTPPVFPDDRGVFAAPYQEEAFVEAVGHPLKLAQTNHSGSRRGTVRGLHFADVPPGQAKYVFCSRGAFLDVIFDLRIGSPTYGTWDSVRLDPQDCRAVYLAEGLGHVAIALEDDSVMTYLCSEGYRPGHEHGVTPLDPELGLPLPEEIVLSDKDRDAPTLAQAREAGLLPSYDDCVAYYAKLRV